MTLRSTRIRAVDGTGEQWRINRALRERIKLRLEEEGIEIPAAQSVAVQGSSS